MKLSRRTLLSTAAAVGGAAAWRGATAVAANGESSTEGPAEARAPRMPALGASMPLTPVPLLDGSTFEPANAEGKLLVVYWWASWCPFCAVQSPRIEALWRAQRDRGLRVLALSIDRDRTTALNYIRQKNYSFPVGMLVPDVARVLPKPKGLPVTVVRGRNGRVVLAEAGEMFPEDIEGIVKFL